MAVSQAYSDALAELERVKSERDELQEQVDRLIGSNRFYHEEWLLVITYDGKNWKLARTLFEDPEESISKKLMRWLGGRVMQQQLDPTVHSVRLVRRCTEVAYEWSSSQGED